MSALSDTSNAVFRDISVAGDVRDDPQWRALLGQDPVKAFLAEMATKHGTHDQRSHGRRGPRVPKVPDVPDAPTPEAAPKPRRQPKPKPPREETPSAPKPRRAGRRAASPEGVRLTAADARDMQRAMLADQPWTGGEKRALNGYSAQDYLDINRILRDPDTDLDMFDEEDLRAYRKQIQTMRAAMRPLSKAVTATRMSNFKAYGITTKPPEAIGSLKALEGKTLQEPGFLSTSITDGAFDPDLPVRLELVLPEGTPAAYLEEISDSPNELELLVDLATKMKIRSVDTSTDPITVKAVVPAATAAKAARRARPAPDAETSEPTGGRTALTDPDNMRLRVVDDEGDILDDPSYQDLLGQGRKRRRIKHTPGGHQHNQDSHGNDHGVDVIPGDGGGKNPLDKLGLAKRIQLAPGEKLLSSRKIRTDDSSFDFLAAEIETPSGRQVRLGIVHPENSKHWAAGSDPVRARRITELDHRIGRIEAGGEDASDDEYQRLIDERSELGDEDDGRDKTAVLTPAAVAQLRAELESAAKRGREHQKAYNAFWDDTPDGQRLTELINERDARLTAAGRGSAQRRADADAAFHAEHGEEFRRLWALAPDSEAVFAEGNVPGGPEGDLHYQAGGYDNAEGGWDIDLGIKPPGADDEWYIGSEFDDKATFEGSRVTGLLKALGELSGDQPKSSRRTTQAKHGSHNQENHGNRGVDLIPPMAGLPVLDDEAYEKEYGTVLDERSISSADGIDLQVRVFELGDAHVVLDLPGGRHQVMSDFDDTDGMRALADDIRAMRDTEIPDVEPAGELIADADSHQHDYYTGVDDLGNIWLRSSDQAEDDYLELSEDEANDLANALDDLADSLDEEFGDAAEIEIVGGKSLRKHGTHDQRTHGRRRTAAVLDVPDVPAPKPVAEPKPPKPRRAPKPKPPADDTPKPSAPRRARAAEPNSGPKPTLEQRIASGEKSAAEISNPDNSNKVYVIKFNDRSRAILKTTKTTEERAVPEFDAEELGAVVAQTLGLSAPEVHRSGPAEAYFAHVKDFAPQAVIGARVAKRVDYKSADALRIGLLDLLTGNIDRHNENWFAENVGTPQERLIPIDHGLTLNETADRQNPKAAPFEHKSFNAPFVARELGGPSVWLDNPLSPAYMASLRQQLESLRPEFERLGRVPWHNWMLSRLDAVAEHAKGTVTL